MQDKNNWDEPIRINAKNGYDDRSHLELMAIKNRLSILIFGHPNFNSMPSIIQAFANVHLTDEQVEELIGILQSYMEWRRNG